MNPLLLKGGCVGALTLVLGCTYKGISYRDSQMPTGYKTYSSDNLEGKYLKDISDYFVSDSDTSQETIDWWNWAFNYRWFVDNRDNPQTISEPFRGINGLDRFKKACGDSYSKTEDEIKKYKGELWKYCSPVGAVPVSIADAKEENEGLFWSGDSSNGNKWGKSKNSELMSTYSGDNDIFWEIKERRFFDSLGKYDTSSKTEDSKKTPFDKLYDQKDLKYRHRRTLRGVCREVYSMSKSDNGDVVKFCGVKNAASAKAK